MELGGGELWSLVTLVKGREGALTAYMGLWTCTSCFSHSSIAKNVILLDMF